MVHTSICDFERISAGDIELLCKCSKCTPNDLMEWKADNEQEDLPNNPMFALKRNESKFDISSIVKDVPVKKLEELQKRDFECSGESEGEVGEDFCLYEFSYHSEFR